MISLDQALQFGQLAFEVKGRLDDVFQPNAVDFLDAASLDPSALLDAVPALAAGVGGLSLVASLCGTAISAATLREVHRLHAKVDTVIEQLNGVHGKLDAMAARVERIDVRVHEQSLRHAFDHVLHRAVRPDGVDLDGLGRLKNDLDLFRESAGNFGLGGAPGLRLATDMHDRLDALATMLAGVRHLIVRRHNLAVAGDPARVIRSNGPSDYMGGGDLKMTAFAHGLASAIDDGRWPIRRWLKSTFMMAGDPEWEQLSSLVSSGITQPLLQRLHAGGAMVPVIALLEDRLDAVRDPTAAMTRLREYVKAWLWQSDAGLVWRVSIEIGGVADGYARTWGYPRLEGDGPLQVIVPIEAVLSGAAARATPALDPQGSLRGGLTSTAGSARLVGVEGPHSGGAFHLPQKTLLVGRDPACDIVLGADARVSSRHARFEWRAGELVVVDLGSTNGTAVNGRALSGEVRVAAGDLVAFASSTFRVER